MKNNNILGISITSLTSQELSQEIGSIILSEGKSMVLNVNIHAMNIAAKEVWFKNLLNEAYINFCDGEGVRLGAKILGVEIKEKITYNRWIWEFAEFSSLNNISWYLVGSKGNVVHQAESVLMAKFSGLKILGSHHGFLSDTVVSNQVVSDIREKSPNVLILGMGMPLQEQWLLKNDSNLNYNVVLTGGAVFEYVAGIAKMTPDMFYTLKLEWFYRFLNDPRRLFKRYFIGNFLFFIRVLVERIKMST